MVLAFLTKHGANLKAAIPKLSAIVKRVAATFIISIAVNAALT